MPEIQQLNLLSVAEHFPDLTGLEKQRFLNRLESWSKLTPAQRQAARDKYRAFSQVPKDKREEVRKMVEEANTRSTP